MKLLITKIELRIAETPSHGDSKIPFGIREKKHFQLSICCRILNDNLIVSVVFQECVTS